MKRLFLLIFAVSALAADPKVKFTTSLGDFVVECDSRKAPVSCANFLGYVKSGFYNGLIFHRVIRGFMVQGGGFDASLNQKQTKAPIKNEAGNGLKNARGTIAMARTNVVDSATSQFFINLVNNDFLDHRDSSPAGFGYAVFGKVVSGMETIDAIAAQQTGVCGGRLPDCPLKTVKILKAEQTGK